MSNKPTLQADVYRWHRLGLAAVVPASGLRQALTQAVAALGPDELPGFVEFLAWHKLAAFWHERLETAALLDSVDDAFAAKLLEHRKAAAALYLLQRQTLATIDQLLEHQQIPYVVIKGVSVREPLYADPSLRPATDIDILIDPANRIEVGRSLIAAGFDFRPKPKDIGHEASFVRGSIAIDLHWNILRIGRTRFNIVSEWLERRQRQDNYWSLDPSDALVLMLVHPAFAKYVSSSNMTLISVVDFILWLRSQPVDCDTVANRLDQMGLATAAWTMLTWFHMIAPPSSLTPHAQQLRDHLRPGLFRQRYLDAWLRYNLADRLLATPLPIQLGLTLALHDKPKDVFGAVRGWRLARSQGHDDPMLRLDREEAVSR